MSRVHVKSNYITLHAHSQTEMSLASAKSTVVTPIRLRQKAAQTYVTAFEGSVYNHLSLRIFSQDMAHILIVP